MAARAQPHILWAGCGDLLRRTMKAVVSLQNDHKAELTFIDIRKADDLKQYPPEGTSYYDVNIKSQRSDLRKYLRQRPLTHIFVANLPPQHMLTAFKFSELCPGGQIVISKPLDTNLTLIETIASGGAWPDVAAKIFVHDHYRNKGAVQPIYEAFPQLIDVYGKLKSFEFYLVESKTVEEEDRLEALNEGVIFDLASHLFALVQLFFLESPNPALKLPGLTLDKVWLEVNSVARARYALCHIENPNAETFAAIVVTLVVEYIRPARTQPIIHKIPGLMVVGKGIKPSQSISADLKGMRFNQELQTRSINLTRNEVNPPLSDLHFAKNSLKEDGFGRPIIRTLGQLKPNIESHIDTITPMMPFIQAAKNAKYIGETIRRAAAPLLFYKAGETLDAVLAKCVGAGLLDHQWLSEAGFVDIGFG